jgi:subtilisin family serine protease
MAVRISHAEAIQTMSLPGVLTVHSDRLYELDTDMRPTLIGAPSIWDGNTYGNLDTMGEGIVIGMIDSGINSEHPSFAEVGGDGYIHVNPYGPNVYHGDCVSVPLPDFCNEKLIGAYDLYPGGSGGPEDTDGHGSHTSSTAGGNVHDAVFTVGTDVYTRTISGVAPHANIVAYKVCNPSCPGSASIAAVNLAIGTDQVDVINYSISGGDVPWNDDVDLAFLDAFAAGIFVSASAGNEGPGAGTVAHTGPWNSSVAASTHSRIIANTADFSATGGSLAGVAAVPGEGIEITTDITDNILYAGDVDPANWNACVAFPAGSFDGVIGLAQRGGCTFAVKVTNLQNAGAVGAVIYNNVGGPPITMGSVPLTIPSVMITLEDGLDLVDLISGDPTATTTIYAGTQLIINTDWQDIMAGFSSRGPSQYELMKPNYTAPGVNILAAVAASGGDPVRYGFLQGTSMSSPHSAGSAALMMALRPDWTVAEIRSAMDGTSNPDPVMDSDGLTPADPYDTGSGRLDLYAAGNVSLVLDETAANMLAADPFYGGEPNSLNLPSLVEFDCQDICSWTRTVTSVYTETTTWDVSTDSVPNLALTVTPSQFTLDEGESIELTIEADVTAAGPGETLFGDVAIWPASGVGIHFPVVVEVAASNPVISVDPGELVSTQIAQLVSRPLAISNLGDLDLEWELYDNGVVLPLLVDWYDDFESYPLGPIHGLGGWKGWGNDPAATGYVTDTISHSPDQSVYVVDFSDLVHEYSGYNTSQWIYTAWQYIPSDYTGQTYFIMLNSYDDSGATNNWSLQVMFDASTNQVINDGATPGQLPLVRGQWMEIRVEIDLVNDIQSVYYGGDLLFTGTWTDEVSGDGQLNIAAVDLWSNGASTVYYDDISLVEDLPDICDLPGDIPWLSTDPVTGTTPGGATSLVDVWFDGTGQPVGTYTATLCAASNDPVTPILQIPVTMNIVEGFWQELPLVFK